MGCDTCHEDGGCVRHDMTRSTRNILIVASAALLVFFGGGYLALRLIGAMIIPVTITDLRQYPTVLATWQGSGLVGHFPAQIPAEATNVRFSAFPGFLQGGAHIQLRMQLPADAIQPIEAELEQATPHAYAGGGFFDHYNRDKDNNLPTTAFHTADSPGSKYAFPEHYTLYVLQASGRSGSWNHGETSGTAVSTTASEVIYWAESW
jgi:hypothetical protein